MIRHCYLILVCALLLLSACWLKKPRDGRPKPAISVLAVLPIERVDDDPVRSTLGRQSAAEPMPSDAGMAVTAQVYRWLADQTRFHFVPDLTVTEALRMSAIRRQPIPLERALALGAEVQADGVIYGRVYRFRNRVGTEYGASVPASVAFELALAAVDLRDVVWRGRFDKTQESLSANLLDWWMFWRAGPKWLSARELAGLGVDRICDGMESAVRP